MSKECIEAKPMNIKEVLEEEYCVPIYQRPYAWEKEHILKLVNTILSQEQIYLGNILIEKNKQEDNRKSELRIIDGQQRITSLLLMLYYLNSNRYNKDTILKKFFIESENERKKLEELFETDKQVVIDNISKELNILKKKEKESKERDLRAINIYKLNFYYISKLLEDEREITEEKILNQIYLANIIIESNLNTTEIFDMINTTGKPLDTKDKFKVRLYNYQNNNTERKEISTYIDKLYKEINEEEQKYIREDNNERKRLFEENYKRENNKAENYIEIVSERYNTEYFLRLFQFFLISKKRKGDVKYSRVLFEMSIDRFYDGLFDYLFSLKRNDNKMKYIQDNLELESNINDEELDNEELIDNNSSNMFTDRLFFQTFVKDEKCITKNEIKEIFCILKDYKEFVSNKDNWKKADAYFSYKLFRGNYCNRYYWTYQYLPILYFYAFKDISRNEEGKFEDIFAEKFGEFIIAISKLCLLYSITKDKIVIDCRNFLSEITVELLRNTNNIKDCTDELIKKINEKSNLQKGELRNILFGNILKNYQKHIICLIIAEKAEEEAKKEDEDLKDKIALLFSACHDIEHIYAQETNNKSNKLEDKYENGIGNLMILESSINKSIRDAKIYDLENIEGKSKIGSIGEKRLSYKDSKFEVVKKFRDKFIKNYQNDTDKYIQDIKNRVQENVKIVEEYFEV